jgi:hypothetical protein
MILDTVPTNYNNFDWQGGKYWIGSIDETDDKKLLVIKVGKTTKRIAFSDFKNKEQAWKHAAILKQNLSDELNLTKNKYKLIRNENGVIKFVIVQLSQGYCGLINIENLDFFKTHSCFVKKSSNDNGYHYFGYSDTDECKGKLFHKQITNYPKIKHVNNYLLDNRLCNLRDINDNNETFIVKTEIITDKKNGFIGMIAYHDKELPDMKVLTVAFKTREDAKEWINNKTIEIDKEYMSDKYYSETLRKEYEDIMNKYADGYKWCDNMPEPKPLEIIEMSDKKLTIYNKFIEQIDNEFELPQKVLCKGTSIKHIDHPTGEYKYCSNKECESWKLVTEFPGNVKNYDGLDRWCKDCKYKNLQSRRKQKRGLTRQELNPEKYKFKCEHCNKMYTAKSALNRHIKEKHS